MSVLQASLRQKLALECRHYGKLDLSQSHQGKGSVSESGIVDWPLRVGDGNAPTPSLTNCLLNSCKDSEHNRVCAGDTSIGANASCPPHATHGGCGGDTLLDAAHAGFKGSGQLRVSHHLRVQRGSRTSNAWTAIVSSLDLYF